MRATLLAALALLAALSGSVADAAPGRIVTAKSVKGCWNLVRKDPWPAYTFCFDGASAIGVGYSGHTSKTGVEAAEAPAAYSVVGGRITLRIDALDYYWPWDATTMTCRLALSGKGLLLTNCAKSNLRGRATAAPDIHLQFSAVQ